MSHDAVCVPYYMDDVVEARATALNAIGLLLIKHMAKDKYVGEVCQPRGSLSVIKHICD